MNGHNLTAEDIGMMELVFLQLAYDKTIDIFYDKEIRSDRKTIVERYEILDAFNDAFKSLKRSLIETGGKQEFQNTMEKIADIADELSNQVELLDLYYLEQMVAKLQYDDSKEMSRLLTLTTLLRISAQTYEKAIGVTNKRTKKITEKLETYLASKKVRTLNGTELDFSTASVEVIIQQIIQQAIEKITSYEN